MKSDQTCHVKMPAVCTCLPSGGKQRRGRYLGTLVLALGLLAILFYAGGGAVSASSVSAAQPEQPMQQKGPDDPKGPEPKQPVKDSPKVVKLSALVSDYEADEFKANKEYRDKTLEVSGYVFGVQNDPGMTKPLVYFVDENHENQISLEVKGVDQDYVALMMDFTTANIPAKFTGTCIGLRAEIVTLKDAVMVEPTVASATKTIEELLAKADADSIARAEELLAAYKKTKVLDDAATQPLAKKVNDARTKLSKTTFLDAAIADLVTYFETDPADEDASYKAKYVQLRGSVSNVKAELKGQSSQFEFTLSDTYLEKSVTCYGAKTKDNAIPKEVEAASKDGTTLTVRGICKGVDGPDKTVCIIECEIIDAETVVRYLLKTNDVIGAKAALAEASGMAADLKKTLEADSDALLKRLPEEAKKAAIVKIKLNNNTEVTLDFSCIAATTWVESAKISLEDPTGEDPHITVTLKYKHFAIEPAKEPTITADALYLVKRVKLKAQMNKDKLVSGSGTMPLLLDKNSIKDNKVTFSLKKR